MADVDYQKQPQVDQLLAEDANCDAYGDTVRCTAIGEQLTELGYTPPEE